MRVPEHNTTAMKAGPAPAFHAIILDMDGLMLDTERMARRLWRSVAAELGFDLDDGLFLRLVGRTRADTDILLAEALGSAFPLETFRRVASERWIDEVAAGGIPRKEGVLELLDAIEDAGVRRAVATSTRRIGADRSLAAAGIAGRFDAVVTGDEVTRGKPAPDIFLVAAGRLGVDPATCIVLEDSLYGIRAAHAAGMVPIMVPDLVEPTDEVRALTHRILDSLHDARAYLFP